MRLWAVLRGGRVVQSRSSYSKPVGGFLGVCDVSPLQMQLPSGSPIALHPKLSDLAISKIGRPRALCHAEEKAMLVPAVLT